MNFQSLLDAFSNVASVIKTIADTPGVNMIPYASTVSSAIDTIQLGVKLGKDVSANITALAETFTPGTIPTGDQLAALDAEIAELRAKLHAALPDKEEGEE